MYGLSSLVPLTWRQQTGWRNTGWLKEGMQVVQKRGTIILIVTAMQASISKAIDYDGLQGIYKLSHSWVIVWPTVLTNNTKCVLKRILIKVPGIKVGAILLFIHPSPHMLNSSYRNQPPSLWKGGGDESVHLPCWERSSSLSYEQHFASVPNTYFYCLVDNAKPCDGLGCSQHNWNCRTDCPPLWQKQLWVDTCCPCNLQILEH
jgi:hypothetical protein